MIDAPSMYPKGFHAVLQENLPDLSGWFKTRRRKYTMDVKYCIIDFGMSSSFKSSAERETVQGFKCQDHTPPESKKWKPYDPFKLDIYVLGNFFLQHYVEVCFKPTYIY